MGLDPENCFNVSIRLTDKKTGTYIELTLENFMQLLLDVECCLSGKKDEFRSSGLGVSGCTISKFSENVYRIEQPHSLASIKFILIHEKSLQKLLQMDYVVFRTALSYDPDQHIKYLRKYVVAATFEASKEKRCDNANYKRGVLEAALKNNNKFENGELKFLCETLSNFENFFTSFVK